MRSQSSTEWMDREFIRGIQLEMSKLTNNYTTDPIGANWVKFRLLQLKLNEARRKQRHAQQST